MDSSGAAKISKDSQTGQRHSMPQPLKNQESLPLLSLTINGQITLLSSSSGVRLVMDLVKKETLSEAISCTWMMA